MRIFLFLFPLFISCQKATTAKSQDEFVPVNEMAKIQLVDLKGNAIVQQKDEYMIVNLWATWCKPCIEEMPSLERMAKQLPENAVLILASDESIERILAFKNARQFDLSFAQLKTSLDVLGVYSLPTTLIVSPNGEIRETLVGTRQWDAPEQLAELLTYLK